jgi:putative CocE/NonD family hydrolase
MYHVSSWYDIFLEGALHGFAGMRERGGSPEARMGQKLLVGPWAHLRPYTSPTSQGTGEADFGPEAMIQLHDHLLSWFDYWLKDMETGIMEEPPVRLFVMGEDRWRDEQEWPLARTHYTRYYLHSNGAAKTYHGNGTLSTIPPDDEHPDVYTYDPQDPVPTLGGCTLIIPQGVYDQRPAEERQDVLVYTSEPLERDLEITGPVVVKLFAASTARDTDFTAKLIDVFPPSSEYPEGLAFNITDSIIRARYRNGWTNPEPMTPGLPYELAFQLYPTSNVFRKGHRIRLDVSSSNWPRFDVNPNTGGPQGREPRYEQAHQSIYHDAARPSHIVLPIQP